MIPPSIRVLAMDNTSLGEKYRWFYDRYSLRNLLESTGFRNVQFMDAHQSKIPGFVDECLDTNQNKDAFRKASLFCEAYK